MFPCFSKRITSDSIDQQWHELRRDDTATDAAADFTSLSISKYLSKWRPHVSPQRGKNLQRRSGESFIQITNMFFGISRESADSIIYIPVGHHFQSNNIQITSRFDYKKCQRL